MIFDTKKNLNEKQYNNYFIQHKNIEINLGAVFL